MLFYNVYLQIYFVFESKSTYTTFKWLFKVRALLQCVSSNIFLFESKSPCTTFRWPLKVYMYCLKVNQYAQHSTGSLRFMFFYNVYLQIYLVFGSKSTCTKFRWLFKVCALLPCISSNIFRF